MRRGPQLFLHGSPLPLCDVVLLSTGRMSRGFARSLTGGVGSYWDLRLAGNEAWESLNTSLAGQTVKVARHGKGASQYHHRMVWKNDRK